MVRSEPVRHVALLAVVLLAAGCLGGGQGGTVPSTPGTPAAPPEPSPDTPTASTGTSSPGTPDTATPTPETTTPTSRGESVEYLVRAGSVPDEFGSVTVTVRVVFVEDPVDLGRCYPDTFTGPYKPTITPLATPVGDCHRSESVTVELADRTGAAGERSLGTFSVPGSAGGHALVATDIDATARNGTAVTAIKGIGGAELLASPSRPDGSYGVELGLEPAPSGAAYDYWLVADRYDPSG